MAAHGRTLSMLLACAALLGKRAEAGGGGQAPAAVGGSVPGGAGYALQFGDNYAAIPNFQNMPSTALTFETWITSTDICSDATVLSYAVDPSALPPGKPGSPDLLQSRAYNNFVVFNLRELIACHDFVWMWKIPDEYLGPPDYYGGCRSFYGDTGGISMDTKLGPDFVDRSGNWHHLAVTWDAATNGTTSVYYDGLLAGYAVTGRTDPIPPGGTLIIGNDQDCLGGCFDASQALYATLDETRLWNVARSQPEILRDMRDLDLGLAPGGSPPSSSSRSVGSQSAPPVYSRPNLVAYYKFDEPKDGTSNVAIWGHHSKAHDYSGNGNDLLLGAPPTLARVEGAPADGADGTTALDFHRQQYAMNYGFEGMPEGDITIEFWAKTDSVVEAGEKPYVLGTSYGHTTLNKGTVQKDEDRYDEFISFSARSLGDGRVDNDGGYADVSYLDDAIVIEKYYTEFQDTPTSRYAGLLENATGVRSTVGAVSVHINANREGNGESNDHWIDFDTAWTDDAWHHVLVTWRKATGKTRLYLDGTERKAFWKSSFGTVSDADDLGATSGGQNIAAGTTRSGRGSLVLGKQQECHGGCFSSTYALDGAMANVRIYDGVVDDPEVVRTLAGSMQPLEQMHDVLSSKRLGLPPVAAVYEFAPENMHMDAETGQPDTARDLGSHLNHLMLGSTSASYVLSNAPMMRAGRPAAKPQPGAAGHALYLSDQQVAIVSEFKGFPSTAITIEFWMRSTDRCREGVPFSYATGPWGGTSANGAMHEGDNSFLLFDYTNWGISVMEDEGHQEGEAIFSGPRTARGSDWRSGVGATDGTFHHIAVTWESATGATHLYDNGRLVWTVKRAQGASIPDKGTLVIGREQDCRGGCFDSGEGAVGLLDDDTATTDIHGIQDFYGIIEELRVWDRVLPQEELNGNIKRDQGLLSGRSSEGGSAAFGTFRNPGVDPHSRGLKAYWKFDEGNGYLARDATGNGNDLVLTEEPSWVVTDWKSLCGDGILQGSEECDDNNRDDGDGCDHMCQVEPGWQCTQTSPSECFNSGAADSAALAIERAEADRAAAEAAAAASSAGGAPAPPVPPAPPPSPPVESSFRSSYFRGQDDGGDGPHGAAESLRWYNKPDADDIVQRFRERDAQDARFGGHEHEGADGRHRHHTAAAAIFGTLFAIASVALTVLVIRRRRVIVPWIQDEAVPALARGWARMTDVLPPSVAQRIGGRGATARRLSRNGARYRGLDDAAADEYLEDDLLPLGGGAGVLGASAGEGRESSRTDPLIQP